VLGFLSRDAGPAPQRRAMRNLLEPQMLHLRATARFLIPAFATAIAVTIIYAAMAPAGQPAPGGVGGDSGPRVDNWVTNSSLDADSSGWRSHVSGDSGSRALWDPHGGRGGTAALYLSSVRRDTLHNDSSAPFWFFVLDSVPVGRRMHFQAWVRGRDCTSEPVLAVQVQSAMRILLSGASTEWKSGLSGTFDWTRLEGAVDIPGGSARARVMAALVGRGEVWFDDFSLTDLAPLSPEERSASRSVAPGLPAAADSGYLFLVRSEERIFTARTRSSSPAGASSVRMQISLPLADRHQVPISFELWTEPRRSLVSGALREDSAGGCFADLVLEPPVWTNSILRKQDRADGILLKWSAQVMVAPESLTLIPTHATLPAVWPAEARPWLRPTRRPGVESGHG
jgi:hypothetical protein